MTTSQAVSLADRILQLKKDVEQASQTRAKAEAALGLATRQLASAEDQLRQLGVTLETAETELAAIRDQLESTISELSTKLAAELHACETVLTAAKKAGIGMTRRYAQETVVTAEKSKSAIEQLLINHGATKYATGWDSGHDTIQFDPFKRTIRFVLPRPDRNDVKYRKDKYGWSLPSTKVQQRIDQADRQRWRALYLVIRAKIEAVEAGISVFEQEFLAFVVLPSGLTVGDSLVPMLQEGRDLPLLSAAKERQ